MVSAAIAASKDLKSSAVRIAPIAAFGFDLLLDVLDLGPDLSEAIPRLLWGLLWMSPLAGFALGHGRSPCDGSVGKRRLSTGVWEKRNPAPRHRFFRIAPGQSQFKADLYARYGDGCMVTDCRIDGLVEAAHIIPYRVNADHHPSNGLLLRADIHTLFDMHLLGIQPETLEVSLHPVAERDGYGYVRGKRLRFLTQLREFLRHL